MWSTSIGHGKSLLSINNCPFATLSRFAVFAHRATLAPQWHVTRYRCDFLITMYSHNVISYITMVPSCPNPQIMEITIWCCDNHEHIYATATNNTIFPIEAEYFRPGICYGWLESLATSAKVPGYATNKENRVVLFFIWHKTSKK